MANKLAILALTAILLFGAAVRLYRMEVLGTFRGDQAIETSGARQILNGKFTLIGIKTSNSEVRNGAVMYYLLAPVLGLMNNNPLAGGILQSVMSLLSAILVYLALKELGKPKEGLIAAFFICLSPLLVQYSRQTLLAYYPLFFNALVFFILTKLTKKFRLWLALVLGIVLGLALQVHYSTLSLVIIALAFPLVKRCPWQYYPAVFLGSIIGFSPMIAFELRHEFFNFKMLMAYLRIPAAGGLSWENYATFWTQTIGRLFFGRPETGGLLTVLTGLLLLRQNLLVVFFAAGSLVMTLVFGRDIREPYPYISHYAITAFIPLVVAAAVFLGRLKPAWLLAGAAAYLVVVFPAYEFTRTGGYSMKPGWSLAQIEHTANIIKEDSRGRKYNVAMLVDGESRAMSWRYFLDFTPNPPMSYENYYEADYLYVATEPGLEPETVPVWEVRSFGSMTVGKVWELPFGYRLYRLDKAPALPDNRFITLIYPVRGRGLWAGTDLKPVKTFVDELNRRKFPATFLFQYDALTDEKLVEAVRKCTRCEFGVFAEASENLNTEAGVSYILGDGHWSRPDKAFFSGYFITERDNLIKTVMEKYSQVFGKYPATVGAWYLDPYSLEKMAADYGLSAYVSVADQFNTDAQRYWGKPWGVPYYAQRGDIMQPAATPEDKSPVLQIQWAHRHPTDAFGNGVWYSQNSLQANDYTNNNRGADYFKEILGYYLDPGENGFAQATIGLEVGQELIGFRRQHEEQLELIGGLVESNRVHLATVGEFAGWYRDRFSGISPVTKITDGRTLWVNDPCYRAGLTKKDDGWQLFDLRAYSVNSYSADYLTADKGYFLSREIPAIPGQSLEDFDFSRSCFTNHRAYRIEGVLMKEKIQEKIAGLASFLVTSVLDGKRVIGLKVGKESLLGYWQGRGPGVYEFPFQTLIKFQHL